MTEKNIRQPIISVLGHVDHGKTLLLDKIRGSKVASREAGAITQHIGATEIPVETVENICGKFLHKFADKEVSLPGLLFIDTPGHEAFANLRSRGGALADLAILVIDITEGFKPQTLESLNHLRKNQTPFVIAANKCDLLPGWNPNPNSCFIETFGGQTKRVQNDLNERIYQLVGKLDEEGFQSERFDRIDNYRKQIGIVPTSAETGEGIPELLAILAGLAQRYLTEELSIEVSGPARGTVLEIKEERGLGKTLDAIIYDGTLSSQDKVAVGALGKVIVTKIRALLQPKPLDEIRDPQEKFDHIDKVSAAAGVKIAAPDIDDVVAGAPIWGIESDEEIEEICDLVRERLESIRIDTDRVGLVVKADTLGSLEALENQLKERNIPIRRADIGNVTRQDVIECSSVAEEDPLFGSILAFNVNTLPHAKEESKNRDIRILTNDVIYRLIEDYEDWIEEKKKEIRRKKLQELTRAGKASIKPGYIFRNCDPAIVGVDILGGVLEPGVYLMNKEGERIGTLKEIQSEQETVNEARTGDELALSIQGPTVGRDIKEGDVLYVDISNQQMKELKDISDMLSEDEKQVMNEIISIKQKENSIYGLM
ncbi:MAG: translation initiation factor IF-2 [Candidatus Hadarchaeota archaeon]